MPCEKLKSASRQNPANHSKRKRADHKLEERKRCARVVRKRFDGYYEKITQEQSREASMAVAKKIKNFL
jgi:hypothetical protein